MSHPNEVGPKTFLASSEITNAYSIIDRVRLYISGCLRFKRTVVKGLSYSTDIKSVYKSSIPIYRGLNHRTRYAVILLIYICVYLRIYYGFKSRFGFIIELKVTE